MRGFHKAVYNDLIIALELAAQRVGQQLLGEVPRQFSLRPAMMTFSSFGDENRFPPGSSPAASIGPPESSWSRQRPMASKFSRPKPMGSRTLWQLAQVGVLPMQFRALT